MNSYLTAGRPCAAKETARPAAAGRVRSQMQVRGPGMLAAGLRNCRLVLSLRPRLNGRIAFLGNTVPRRQREAVTGMPVAARIVGVGFALALLAAATCIATGQVRAAAAEAITTTLYPGDNLVGWLGPAAPVEQVFEALPRLSSVRSDRGHAARESLADGRPTRTRLRTLETGAGYWFRIEGSAPVAWQRTAAEGPPRLDLQPGRQLVAWTGRDRIRLRSAVRGIADSVRLAWTWDAASQRMRIWSPAAPEGYDLTAPVSNAWEPPRVQVVPWIQTGQAVGIVLHEAVRWRQPTGELPTIEFYGDVPEQIRREVRADLRWVVSHFIDHYGVEAVPERLQILVWAKPEDIFWRVDPATADVKAFMHAPEDPGRSLSSIVMGMKDWAPRQRDPVSGQPIYGRMVLLHEYYHAVQAHLAGREFHGIPKWLVEAGPTRLMHAQVGSRQQVHVDMQVAAQFQLGVDELNAEFVQRADGLIVGGSPRHAMGHSVAIWLAERFGANAHFRLWRNFAKPQLSQASWQHVLRYSYGLDLEALIEEHQEWIRERYPLITGTVVAPERIDVSELYLGVQGTLSTAVLQLTINADGSFRIALAADGRYRFALSSADRTCSGYSTANGVVGDVDSAPWFKIDHEVIDSLTITVPEDFCLPYLRGQVTSDAEASLADLQVAACRSETLCGHGLTDDAGRFEVPLPGPGRYTVSLTEGGLSCKLFYRDGSTVAHRGRASRVVVGSDPPTLSIRLPEPICGYEIRGRLSGLPETAPLMPMQGIWENELRVSAFPSSGGKGVSGELQADGSFRILVAGPGSYQLTISPVISQFSGVITSCRGRFRTGLESYATDVQVTETGHEPIVWEVPEDFCRWRASGRVTGPDGDGIAGFAVSACEIGPTGYSWSCGAGTYTELDGHFELYVPYRGDFFVAPTPRGSCWLEAFYDHRVHTSMNGNDISGLRLSLPDELCGDD